VISDGASDALDFITTSTANGKIAPSAIAKPAAEGGMSYCAGRGRHIDPDQAAVNIEMETVIDKAK
jgi:hypothetical protein